MRETRRQVYNLELGSFRSSTQPVIDSVTQKGVHLTSAIVTDLRTGRYKGRQITEQLLANEILTSNTSGQKDLLYSSFFSSGLALRATLLSTSNRYNALNLINDIGKSREESGGTIRALLRASRVDIVLYDKQFKDQKIRDAFSYSVQQYLEAYKSPPSLRPKLWPLIKNSWNYGTIEDFYKILYREASTWTIATWIPYELQAFSDFYTVQRNKAFPLTPFDEIILQETMQNRDVDNLSEEIARQSHIPIQRYEVRLHKNALLYGTLRIDKKVYQSS